MIILVILCTIASFSMTYNLLSIVIPDEGLRALCSLVVPPAVWWYFMHVAQVANKTVENPPRMKSNWTEMDDYYNKWQHVLSQCHLDMSDWSLRPKVELTSDFLGSFKFTEQDIFGNTMEWRIDLKTSLEKDQNPGAIGYFVKMTYFVETKPQKPAMGARYLNKLWGRETANKIIGRTTCAVYKALA